MNHINTEIEKIIVEINDREYELAEKTIETAEKLMEAGRKMKNQPEYKLWLAELEIIMGRDAVRELFNAGKKENLDRMYRIYNGVMEAWEYNAKQVQDEKIERQQARFEAVTELMRQIAAAAKAGETKYTVRKETVCRG